MQIRFFLFLNIIHFLYSSNIIAKEIDFQLADTSKAILYFEKAKIAKSKGEYNKAMTFYQKALIIREEHSGDYEPDIIRIYNNIGGIYFNLQQLEKALDFYNKAEICLKNKFGIAHSWLGTIYMNKGNICYLKEDYEKALFYYNEAYGINKRNENIKGIVSTLYNIGLVYFNMEYNDQALYYFLESISAYKNEQIFSFERIYNMLGMVYVKLGDIKEAEKYYKKSIFFREKKYGYKNYETAKGYYYYGSFCIDQGIKEKGLELQSNAYSILLKTVGFNNSYTSKVLLEIGDYYSQSEKLDSALYYFQQALQSITPEFNSFDFSINPKVGQAISKVDLARILKKKALTLQQYAEKNSLEQEYYLQLSLETYERAIEAIEQLRSGYLFEESKLFLTQNEKETYSELIDAALCLYNLTHKKEYAAKAYAYAEKSKAAVLQSSMQEVKAKEVGGIPDSLQQKEININREIAVYEKFVHDEKESGTYDTTKVEQWESTIFNLYREKEDLLALFESQYPVYHKLKFNTEIIGLEIIQEQLKKDEAVLEYSLADSILYTFAITKDSVQIIEQKAGKRFIKNVEEFTECLSVPSYGHYSYKELAEFVHVSYDLYKILIKPFESFIKGHKLVIIPDGELAFIPMGALINSGKVPEEVSFSGLPYLIKEYDFSYAYSATILMDAKAIKGKKRVKIGAFAPDYSGTEFIELGNEEALTALKTYKGDLYESDSATEKIFKEKSQEYDVLHLSMHGLMDIKDPMYSKLVFTMDEDSLEDGFLHAYEIYNMSIDANMVVLSACNTGAGKLQKGEGVMSLARAFTYAGSPAVVTSLWPVVNATGTEIMNGFYESLSDGKTKSSSLSLSKSNYLANAVPSRSHPHYWAGYVVLGDPRPMSKGCNWYCYTTVLLILIGGFIVIRKRKM